MKQREVYRFVLDEPIRFKVKVNSNQTVYCGLEQTGKNEFEGKTTGLTLVSGLYDCYEKDGVRMVYPYLHYYMGQKKMLDNLSTNIVELKLCQMIFGRLFLFLKQAVPVSLPDIADLPNRW